MKRILLFLAVAVLLVLVGGIVFAESDEKIKPVFHKFSDSDNSSRTNSTETQENEIETNDFEKTDMRIKIMDSANGDHEEIEEKIVGRNINFSLEDDDTMMIIANKVSAKTELNLTVDNLTDTSLGQNLRVYLSNGRYAKVRVMPDEASDISMGKFGLKCYNNCSIILKEVGKDNETKPVYQIESIEDMKMLFLFNAKVKVKATVDAEGGELLDIYKPWWTFLGGFQRKVTICHISNENSTSQTIKVSYNAVDAHFKHGDYLGDCDNVTVSG